MWTAKINTFIIVFLVKICMLPVEELQKPEVRDRVKTAMDITSKEFPNRWDLLRDWV